MTSWTEPQNVTEWLRRLFALRPVLLTLLIIGLLVLELRFDWVEHALGDYLASTNPMRPESGAIWEEGRQTRRAREALEEIVIDRQASQREARNATTLTQIAAIAASRGGVMLSAERFRNLYLKLPPAIALEIASAYELLRLGSDGRWQRTYFEKSDGGLTVYLLDVQNRALRQLEVPADLLNDLDPGDLAREESLEELPSFAERIYPAERFLAVLEVFSEEIRRSVVPHPEKLLNTPGRIIRVGISDETVAGFITLGFEILSGTQRRVVLVRGRDWAVWRLRAQLEEAKKSNPMK
ncbi:MAG: hypothetical protein JSW39_07265 [Desulfobacterales bacterium]|nr:MAG: hypothetical protein JSW39_07265 [Desulfobacterales bacterium]